MPALDRSSQILAWKTSPILVRMTNGGDIAEEPGTVAFVQAMIARLLLLLAALMRVHTSRRGLEGHARLASWFALAEARALAGDRRALLLILMAARRIKHTMVRDNTIAGRFYKRRRHAVFIACRERRFSAPRRRRLAARARASIPFTHVNPAPP